MESAERHQGCSCCIPARLMLPKLEKGGACAYWCWGLAGLSGVRFWPI
jgi:hypothetical protein